MADTLATEPFQERRYKLLAAQKAQLHPLALFQVLHMLTFSCQKQLVHTMRSLIVVMGALLTLGCGSANVPPESAKGVPEMTLTLTSSAFDEGTAIPRDYTCDGSNKQLPIAWAGAPAGTVEFALTMDDPDANGFVHWVVTGIPADAAAFSGGLPAGAQAGQPYRGPCPPSGTHHYVLTLYALSAPLGDNATTAAQVMAAASDKTLTSTTLTGTYRRGSAT
jgi:Raf kinase inhibitor-like YbhB/YbcL family protein